jgi:chemotaxis signal transduction protein
VALATLGDLRLGVDAALVVQALPCPEQLTRLPGAHVGVRGVLNLRGQAVPVVDLRHWMPSPVPTEDLAPAQILVVGDLQRKVGVLVDAMQGLVRLEGSGVQRVLQGREGFFHSVARHPGDGGLVSLLDPGSLMDTTRAWAPCHQGAWADPAAAGPADSRSPLTAEQVLATVRLGSVVLGLPAEAVADVLPAPAVQRLFGSETDLLGMALWRGRDLPVLDPVKVLGLAPDGPAALSPLLMVLEHQGLLAGVPVDEVRAVQRLDPGLVQAVDHLGLTHAHLYLGTWVPAEDQRVLLLDAPAVLKTCSLSRLSAAAAGGPPDQGPQLLALEAPMGAVGSMNAADDQAHVVFTHGPHGALPLSVLQEITPAPRDIRRDRPTGKGVLGTCEWRGVALPLIDLRPPSAGSGDGPEGRMLVVNVKGRRAGLLVHDVIELIPARTGTHTRLRLAGGQRVHMITVGVPPQRKSHQVMDLESLPFFAAD